MIIQISSVRAGSSARARKNCYIGHPTVSEFSKIGANTFLILCWKKTLRSIQFNDIAHHITTRNHDAITWLIRLVADVLISEFGKPGHYQELTGTQESGLLFHTPGSMPQSAHWGGGPYSAC